MSISTLPDLCLVFIFDRIPLRDLLTTVNRVCHRWENLRPFVCHRRHHPLILAEGKIYIYNLVDSIGFRFRHNLLYQITNDDGTSYHDYSLERHIEYHSLVLARLSVEAAVQLVKQLPNITSLQISQSVNWWPTLIHSLNFLLYIWAPKLAHLNLWLANNHRDGQLNGYSTEWANYLFDQINRLPALKRLNLRVYFPIKQNYKLVTKLLILSQVEQFEYKGTNDTFDQFVYDNIEDALKQTNCALKRINLGHHMELDRFLEFTPKLLSRVANCWIPVEMSSWATLDRFRLLLSRFVSLETLEIKMSQLLDISYSHLINLLSHLPHLILLQLTEISEQFFAQTEIRKPHPIPSIKALDFKIQTSLTHKSIANLFLPTTFPNVQVIRLSHFTPKCAECGMDIGRFDSGRAGHQTMVRECTEVMMKPLKECAKLRTIDCTRYFKWRLSNSNKHVITLDHNREFVFT